MFARFDHENRVNRGPDPILVIICVLVASSLLLSCDPRRSPGVQRLIEESDRRLTEQAERVIEKDPVLREMDRVCTQIPLPLDFTLIRKGGLDDRVVTISYYYTSEIPYEVSRSLWNDYFLRESWDGPIEKDSFPKELRYSNKEYEIQIYFGGMGKAKYSISCLKRS